MNMKLLFLFLTGVYYVHCIDVHCVNDDPFRTFRCPDGTYISDRLVCDGNEDCSEGYDEKFAGCNRNQKDMWTHKRHRVRGFWGKCEDSKPRNTGYEVNNIEECSSDKGKFLCHDNSRCLDQINKCDGFCNCFDCSDEDNNCLNSDEDLADTENSFNASDSAVTQLFYSIEKRAIKTMHISTNEEFIIKEIADDCTALTAAGDYVYYATDESTYMGHVF
ncbi:low-density lipoprotein receptor-related protein 8-like [Planococcus citri]|uniref:low-density lipoprotein receptor-related protein 8-like n=1 Tax=Planococcus citri TaxID=170843 RepID=UPI0031F75F55